MAKSKSKAEPKKRKPNLEDRVTTLEQRFDDLKECTLRNRPIKDV